jgi:hypothetical protein
MLAGVVLRTDAIDNSGPSHYRTNSSYVHEGFFTLRRLLCILMLVPIMIKYALKTCNFAVIGG